MGRGSPRARAADRRGAGRGVPRRARASAAGRSTATRIGAGGGSNFTFLLERGAERYVLRRPPRPPLPPSAHDMVREARLQLAFAPRASACRRSSRSATTTTVLGVPFYVMRYLEATWSRRAAARARDGGRAPRARARSRRHARRDPRRRVSRPALAAFARPGSYLERQVRRFTQLWEINRTRELPAVDEVGAWLAASAP